MARRHGRRQNHLQFEQVVRQVVCPKGHGVGKVWKSISPHPTPGYHTSRLTWVDTTAGGKLVGHCAECGAEVQVRWDRAKAELDQGHINERYTGDFDPSQ